eukprot:TRINITY_DN39640_c0_g1_i1.p1 TRINITY_DN39640_c0_g1~~TRINITY_DN39640_c0_g1_i1.p1  ORF type:complete len:438 (-),score=84.66 TRINITY_DN39640_c0_g1_i1:12-1325(-)
MQCRLLRGLPTAVSLQRPCPLRLHCMSRSVASQAVNIPFARLEQLLEAEITTLALRSPKPLTVQTLLEVTEESSVEELARLLHEELPVRFAQRIKMLEALPDWKSKRSIAAVRQMYVTSFKELRMADVHQPDQFQQHIQAIKERHSQTNLLVGGFKQYAEVNDLPVSEINEWLDRFFALRLSTNMLMSHYLQMSRGLDSIPGSLEGTELDFDPKHNPYRSSIDPECNIPRIAQHAADVVAQMSRLRYGVAPPIEVLDRGSQALPFVPRYFLYIISELLKNSVRATVELHGKANQGSTGQSLTLEEELPPVRVMVSGDENVCCARISDEGGGIPRDQLPHVWSYLYTTAEPIEVPVSRRSVDAPADLSRLLGQKAREAVPNAGICGSPLAGLGCGLPLSNLYARHLGGSVELQSMPRYGTDVYVYINRVGKNESLPDL